ncbi:MAG: hypothetical protein B7X07_02730 [Actinobacteria bacterium 21-64-8]|nr:MAG: hypothetical protein B7X07_02730 [Actinobacteria bacterium 21-64-8]
MPRAVSTVGHLRRRLMMNDRIEETLRRLRRRAVAASKSTANLATTNVGGRVHVIAPVTVGIARD